MASGWMKSLHCKSKAFDDVVHHPSSCRNSFQSLKDIVETTKKPKPKKPKRAPSPPFKRPESESEPGIRTRPAGARSFFPSLTELPKDHPSRNVVEIIFHTRWGEKTFPGRVEMVFKVQNLTRTLTRFEEYRDAVKRRAGGGDVRCIADGNEVMRFHCLGAAVDGGACEAGGGAWVFQGSKRAAVCTYSGSGVAHERGGGGRGRRAMLVCRVVAGRVRKQHGFESGLDDRVGFDSVSSENGELLVFDTRALLPCFLIIYKL